MVPSLYESGSELLLKDVHVYCIGLTKNKNLYQNILHRPSTRVTIGTLDARHFDGENPVTFYWIIKLGIEKIKNPWIVIPNNGGHVCK